MKLDRAGITQHAFATAADGYDREAVEAHLTAIADLVVKHAPASVGAEASERLRQIVDGAEESTSALRQASEEEAEALLASAREEARAVREKAATEAGAQIAQARAAVRGLLGRVDGLQTGVEDAQQAVQRAAREMSDSLGAGSEPVVGVLRERAQALGAELDLMGAGVLRERETPTHQAPAEPTKEETRAPPAEAPKATEKAARTEAAGATEEAAGTGLAPGDLADAAAGLDVGGEGGPSDDAPPEASADETPEAEAPKGESETPQAETESADAGSEGAGDGAAEGRERARLAALNMALTGTDRTEAEARLREQFDGDGLAEILDEVYARTEGDDKP